MDRYEALFKTTADQFGFKSKHSTELCVFTLKQVVDYYKSMNSVIYLCFLDASKAFDTVNDWNLFENVMHRNVSYIIVRLLLVWYNIQKFYIQWGDTKT